MRPAPESVPQRRSFHGHARGCAFDDRRQSRRRPQSSFLAARDSLDLGDPRPFPRLRPRRGLADARAERSRIRSLAAGHARPADGGGLRQGQDARRPACAVLRPLRRAARRPDRAVDDAALRAAPRGRAERAAHRRARRLRRQRPVDDLRRGLPRLPPDRRPAVQRQRAVGGRRGNGLALPARLPRQERQDAEGGPGSRLRHVHVGRKNPRDHHDAARAGARGGRGAWAQARPPLRALRRRGDQSDPRARAHPGRPARRQRRGRPARVLRASRNCPRRSPSNGAASISTTRLSKAKSASPFPRAKRAARRWR